MDWKKKKTDMDEGVGEEQQVLRRRRRMNTTRACLGRHTSAALRQLWQG